MFQYFRWVQFIALSSLCLTVPLFGFDSAIPMRLDGANATLLAEAMYLRKTFGDKIWPGFGGSVIPIVVITEKNEFAINFPKKLERFASIGIDPILGTEIQVGERLHSTNLVASFQLQGIDAVVIGAPALIERNGAKWIITVIHESFHVFQSQNGGHRKIDETELGKGSPDGSWMLNFPFPYKNQSVMGAIHLQGFSLYLAATEGDPGNATYALGTVLDSINVYRNLLQLVMEGTGSYKYSCLEEWVEGVAFYTEYKIVKMVIEDVAYKPTKAFECLPEEMSYLRAWDTYYKHLPNLIKHAGKAAKSRTAFYHLGFGKALALDRLLPDWKKRYFSPKLWLDDLIGEAVVSANPN